MLVCRNVSALRRGRAARTASSGEPLGRSRAAIAALVAIGLTTGTGLSTAVHATGPASDVPADAPPPAAPGTCFARVSVPAFHEIEPVEIERRAASARFEILPARLEPRKRRIVSSEASTTLRAVQPVLVSETRRRELAPATTRWVRDSLDGELPLGPGDRLALFAAGVTSESIAPGTCLVEHYRPARIATTPERVLVREASEQLFVTEAVFERASESFVARPSHTRLVEVPTVWKADTRQVVTESVRVDHEAGADPLTRPDGTNGEPVHRSDEPVRSTARSHVTVEHPATLTRVHEPALHESVEVRRLVRDAVGTREPSPAVWDTIGIPHVEAPAEFAWRIARADVTSEDISSEDVPDGEPPAGAARADDPSVPTGRTLCHREWPAEAIEYERLVVREEGRFERETRPAEHVVHEVQVLLEDARGVRVDVPAVIETLERRVRARAASVEWRPVLCGTQVNDALVNRLQQALDREGFSPGAIDGRLGPGTLEAVAGYQRANALATGGLTLETVEALGVEF